MRRNPLCGLEFSLPRLACQANHDWPPSANHTTIAEHIPLLSLTLLSYSVLLPCTYLLSFSRYSEDASRGSLTVFALPSPAHSVLSCAVEGTSSLHARSATACYSLYRVLIRTLCSLLCCRSIQRSTVQSHVVREHLSHSSQWFRVFVNTPVVSSRLLLSTAHSGHRSSTAHDPAASRPSSSRSAAVGHDCSRTSLSLPPSTSGQRIRWPLSSSEQRPPSSRSPSTSGQHRSTPLTLCSSTQIWRSPDTEVCTIQPLSL